MRLAQLARKVSVRPSEIVVFLAKRGIAIEENANSRVEDADALSVIETFAPGLLETHSVLAESSPVEPTPAILRDQANTVEPPGSEVSSESLDEEIHESSPEQIDKQDFESPSAETLPDLIKAPKVELKGLKVVGKIELPQPRKKETPQAPENAEQEGVVPTNQREQRVHNRDRQRSHKAPRPAKNPVALERERQAQEAAQKKQRQVEEEKERRKKYYAARVKPSVPSRSVRLIDEPVSTLSEEGPEKPKGLLRRFIHWLTTY